MATRGFQSLPVRSSNGSRRRSRSHASCRHDASALDIVAAAARAGLVDPHADLLSSAVAVEAVAWESAGAAIALALHTGVTSGLADGETIAPLVRGEVVGAIALSSDEVPAADGVTLVGRASWVTPLTHARARDRRRAKRRYADRRGGAARCEGYYAGTRRDRRAQRSGLRPRPVRRERRSRRQARRSRSCRARACCWRPPVSAWAGEHCTRR